VLVDLVQTQTRDGVRLDGVFQVPERGAPVFPLDAFCLVHGTGGNFYSSTLFDHLTERLLKLGCAVLRVNTRGHDGISTAGTSQGGRRQGAAYEVVDDCRHDLAAWVDWLRQRAGPRVGLLGHSLGAVKCLYALTSPDAPPLAGLIALSPPRLSYSWFCASAKGPAFLETYRQADQLMQARQPTALLEVKLPLSFVITAAGYVEKYGPDERYNFLRLATGVPCPTLVTFGAEEVASNMAFQQAPEELQALARQQPRLAVSVIPRGDHFYSGVRGELLQCIEGWIDSALRRG
jgi:pimeloyl-ACP methyl ester carboxylesterase